MTTKRVLHRIRLDKIAAVGDPCQEHATVAIIKRAPGDPARRIAKVTFTEALTGAMVAERVNEAFWRSFDNLWTQNDAFRRALTDELSAGGDGTTASADYIASVSALVEEAVTAARSAGAAATDADIEKAITDAVTSWIEKSQPKEQTMTILTKAQLKTAAASFAIAKSTVAEMNEIVDAAITLDAADELPANQPELVAAVKARQAPASDETKVLKRQVAVLSLNPDVRKHFDGLAADAQDAFLAKSAADQVAEVEAANNADPVVFKTKGGVEIRKSDGAAAAMLARQNDELVGRLDNIEKSQTGSAIEKRARDEFPNVALATAQNMLKSVAALGADTDEGKAVLASLSTMNKSRSGLFKSLGTTETNEGPGDIQKARVDYDAAVSKIAARDKIGLGDAMSKARVEEPALFAAAFPESAEEDAEA